MEMVNISILCYYEIQIYRIRPREQAWPEYIKVVYIRSLTSVKVSFHSDFSSSEMVTAWAGGSAGAVEDIFEKNDTSTTKDKVEVISTWAVQRDHTHTHTALY